MNESLEEELADFCSSVSWTDIPITTQSHLLALIRDALTVASVGNAAPRIQEFISKSTGPNGSGSANVWFQDLWTDGPTAALINSALLQAWDYDDVHDAGLVHVMCLMLPSVLAAAQSDDSHGGTAEFLTSLAIGAELLCRLGKRAQPLNGWTATSTLGGMAAAAAVAKFLGRDRKAIANAMGIAYLQSAGNGQALAEAAPAKKFQAGFAAQSALRSVQLSDAGLQGPRRFLSGKLGYFSLYAKKTADFSLGLDSGMDWEVDNVAVKEFPCARGTHGVAIACIEAARGLDLRAEDIEYVEISAPSLVCDLPVLVGLDSRLERISVPEAILSPAYVASTCLLTGGFALADLQSGPLGSRDRIEVAGRVVLEVSEVDHGLSSLVPVRVRVGLRNGRLLHGRCDDLSSSGRGDHQHKAPQTKQAECAAVAGLGTQRMISQMEQCVMNYADEVDLARSLSVILSARPERSDDDA